MELDYQLVVEAIREYNTIIIHRHKRPDPDAIGSQLGLKYLIEAGFPDKKVLATGSMTTGLAWLGKMDKVVEEDYQGALVIVTDTANQERIDGEKYYLGDKLIKIDHHPETDLYGDIQCVSVHASSCSELIVELSQKFKHELPLTKKAAEVLYAGMVGDTGRFMFKSTTSKTLKLAACCYDAGIDAFAINDQFQLATIEELKFQAFALDRLVVIPNTGVAYLRIDQADMQRYNISQEQTNLVVNLAARIIGVCCWVTFIQQEGNTFNYRCRIRSKGPVINEIAQRYHGGGHPLASGANAYSEEEIQSIIDELIEVAK